MVNGHILPARMDEDFALRKMIHTGDHIQKRGFSGAGLSNNAQELARVNLCINTAQSGKLSGFAGIDLDHAAQLNLRSGILKDWSGRENRICCHEIPQPIKNLSSSENLEQNHILLDTDH
jgi:hypothetical protein